MGQEGGQGGSRKSKNNCSWPADGYQKGAREGGGKDGPQWGGEKQTKRIEFGGWSSRSASSEGPEQQKGGIGLPIHERLALKLKVRLGILDARKNRNGFRRI